MRNEIKMITIYAIPLCAFIVSYQSFGQVKGGCVIAADFIGVPFKHVNNDITDISRIPDQAINDLAREASKEKRHKIMLLISCIFGGVFVSVAIVFAKRKWVKRQHSPPR